MLTDKQSKNDENNLELITSLSQSR